MSCKNKIHISAGLSGCSNPEHTYALHGCGESCRGYKEEEDTPDVTDMDDIKAKFHEYKSNMIKSMNEILGEKNDLEAEIVELQKENRRLSSAPLLTEHRRVSLTEGATEVIRLCTQIIDEVN